MAPVNRDDITQAILEVGSDGWTEGGDLASIQEGARRAAGFISLLPESVPAPAVVQGSNGGVALEWRSSDNGMLLIEFLGGRRAGYQVRSGGIECQGETDGVEELAKLIAEAMSS